jgi:uncharacterized membrane protein (UPF0136 family)
MPTWLRELLPGGVAQLLAPFFSPTALVVLSVASVAMFLASLVGVPWFLQRIPHDYFTRRDTLPIGGAPGRHPAARAALLIARNVFGVVLFVAGLIMLVLPGQGLIAIFVSMFFIDFPRKRRLQRRVVGSPRVLAAINHLRRRFGEPPLECPPR